MESKISSKPPDSSPDSYLVALKNLSEMGAIHVTYPKQSSGTKVETPTSAVTKAEIETPMFVVPQDEIENTTYSEEVSQLAQEFSHENSENVSD